MNERILVVDDEEDLRLSLKFKLKSAGFDVDVAADGEGALEKLKAKPADAVLLDITMPRMSGIELCRAAHAVRPSLPVVVVTGSTHETSADRAREAGAWGVVVKPFSRHELALAVRHALDDAGPAEGRAAPPRPPSQDEGP